MDERRCNTVAHEDDQIVHYGVLGMRWGVRREEVGNGGSQKMVAPDHKDYADNSKRPIREMSNAELKRIIERDRLEREAKTASRTPMTRGMAAVTKFLSNTATMATVALATPAVVWAGKQLLSKIFGKTAISEIYKSSKK